MVMVQYDDTIRAALARIEAEYQPRRRLGLSQIGNQCARNLWLRHQGITGTPPDGRRLMLFRLGEMVEDYLADILGVGRRQEEVVYQGLLCGHIDGTIYPVESPGTEHLWECKTASAKNFKKIKELGYEAYSIVYCAQIHCYAYLTGLDRILVTVYCKDTSEIYCERIRTDTDYATMHLERAVDIIQAVHPPRITCRDADCFTARFCDYSDYCFGGEAPIQDQQQIRF